MPRSFATGARSIARKAARMTLTSSSERRSRQVVRDRRVLLLPKTADVVRQLPPEPKRKVRAALAELLRDPDLGEPLERELTGMRRIRVGRLRIVYRVSAVALEIVAIGPRRTIYAELEREARRTDARP
jgi:mRNA-degrading endonuclease RelE of RelBE toxin-antitoxin system